MGDLEGNPADECLKIAKILCSEITGVWLFDRKLEVWGPVSDFGGTEEYKQILYFKCWEKDYYSGGSGGKEKRLKKRLGLF